MLKDSSAASCKRTSFGRVTSAGNEFSAEVRQYRRSRARRTSARDHLVDREPVREQERPGRVAVRRPSSGQKALIFSSCDQHHRLVRLASREVSRLDGGRIMTQLSDSTWMVIHSVAVTLLVLLWVYIPA